MGEHLECSKTVRGSHWPATHPCRKPYKVTRDGKDYCAIHDPARVRARFELREKAMMEGQARAAKQFQLERAAPTLLQALRDAPEPVLPEMGTWGDKELSAVDAAKLACELHNYALHCAEWYRTVRQQAIDAAEGKVKP